MKNRFLFFCIGLSFFLFFACNPEKKREITPGNVLSGMVTTINLSPEKNKKIILSEIIQTIDVIPLEISDQSLIGGISKIVVDENCFFILNEYDKLVYAFDKEGRFLNRIGSRGNGPGEVHFPQCFAIDKLRKEVWLTDNHLFLKKYDYNGNFREQETFSLFYKDFHIGSTGEKYFHASKMTNFKPNGDPDCWNLFVSDLSDQLVTYFPYEIEIYPNGELYFDTSTPFNESNGKITYHYAFCDTIYQITTGGLQAAYVVNFGSKRSSVDLSLIPGEEALEYIRKNNDRACYVQNYLEAADFIKFNYVMGTQVYDAFYDKKNNTVAEGILINDLFDARINFLAVSENKLVGYMNAFDIKLQENAGFPKSFLSEKLAGLSEESNPVLVEIVLKELK